MTKSKYVMLHRPGKLRGEAEGAINPPIMQKYQVLIGLTQDLCAHSCYVLGKRCHSRLKRSAERREMIFINVYINLREGSP